MHVGELHVAECSSGGGDTVADGGPRGLRPYRKEKKSSVDKNRGCGIGKEKICERRGRW